MLALKCWEAIKCTKNKNIQWKSICLEPLPVEIIWTANIKAKTKSWMRICESKYPVGKERSKHIKASP